MPLVTWCCFKTNFKMILPFYSLKTFDLLNFSLFAISKAAKESEMRTQMANVKQETVSEKELRGKREKDRGSQK